MDPFSVLPQDWVRNQFGIDEGEYPEEPTIPEEDPNQQKLQIGNIQP
jgi:hypothetical protein